MSADIDVTALLHAWQGGDRDAFDRLLAALYAELGRLARFRLRGERDGHTLDTVALVHEAYLRLAGIERLDWRDRAHFLAMASRVMRRVLLDHAASRRTQRRGGGRRRVPLDDRHVTTGPEEDAFVLSRLLERMEGSHPRQAEAIQMHYLGGLTQQEIAFVRGVSQPTIQRDLQFGRAWLARAWRDDDTGRANADA